MTVQINYKNTGLKKTVSNLVLFVGEKFNIDNLKGYISKDEYAYISDLLNTSNFKKKLLSFKINSKKTIFLVSINKNLKVSDIENLGAQFYKELNSEKKTEYTIFADSISSKVENFLGYFLHGLKLKSYKFNIYKTKKDKKLIIFNVI